MKINQEKESEEMIEGMIFKEELRLFFDDPEGYSECNDYIEKIIDNYYQFAKDQSNRRMKLKLVSKILERRKLQKKVKFTMPLYTDTLKQWEGEVVKKHNLDSELFDESDEF